MDEKIKKRLDYIFECLGNYTNSVWVRGKLWEYREDLVYSSYILGQKVTIVIGFYNKRLKAKVFIGEYGKDIGFFSKEISFKLEKTERQIINDLLFRLEISNAEKKIRGILDDRERKRLQNDEHYYLMELFKKFLPFEASYYSGDLSCVKNGIRVELSILGKPSLRVEAKEDILLKICALLSRDFVGVSK